jgi:hypothetical protein
MHNELNLTLFDNFKGKINKICEKHLELSLMIRVGPRACERDMSFGDEN